MPKEESKEESKEKVEKPTCPITLEEIEPEHDIEIKFDDCSTCFHYDVRALLEHIQHSTHPIDPLTRKPYSERQINMIRQKAIGCGEIPLHEETKSAIIAIEGLMNEVVEFARFLAMSSLMEEIDEYLYNTKQFFIENGKEAPVDSSVFGLMVIDAQSKKERWMSQIRRHRRLTTWHERREQQQQQRITLPIPVSYQASISILFENEEERE